MNRRRATLSLLLLLAGCAGPTLKDTPDSPFIPTPPFPSYPAGHPTYSGGSAKLLTYFFPKAGETLNKLADQVGLSRVYGGIHYPEDSSAGLQLGRAIADDFIARAKKD